MDKDTLGGIIRSVIITLATGVTVNGYTVTGSDAQQIGGLALIVFGIIWSILQKKGLTPL